MLASRLPLRVRGPSSEPEAEAWYRALFELLHRRPEIKAVSLISVDWRRLEPDLPGWGWPDTRVGAWPGAAALVRREFSRVRYLGRGDAQREALGLTSGCT